MVRVTAIKLNVPKHDKVRFTFCSVPLGHPRALTTLVGSTTFDASRTENSSI